MGKIEQWFLEEVNINILFVIVSGIEFVLSFGEWMNNSIPFDIS